MQSIPLKQDILVKKVVIRDIPIIEIVTGKNANKKLPTVFFYHGFSDSKERHVQDGYELAKYGFRVVIPDALMHNERAETPITIEGFQFFWQIIMSNINEFQLLKQVYVGNGLTDEKRIGVVGSSMGGFTTCALLTTDPSIKAAVVLMGSPEPVAFAQRLSSEGVPPEFAHLKEAFLSEIESLKSIDLSMDPELLAGRPVLFWHDTEDPIVPYANTKAFYDKMKETPAGKNLSFDTSTGRGHVVHYETTVLLSEFFNKNL